MHKEEKKLSVYAEQVVGSKGCPKRYIASSSRVVGPHPVIQTQ